MNYDEMAVEILEQITELDGLSEDKDLDLFEAGLLDSLAVIEVIVQIEVMTGVKLQPTDFVREDISSVDNLSAFLRNKEIKNETVQDYFDCIVNNSN